MIGSKRALLSSTGIKPLLLLQYNFTKSSVLPPWLAFSRAGNATVYDSTGKLTYAPNNLLTYSNALSNAAWGNNINITLAQNVTDPFGVANNGWTVTASGATPPQQFSQSPVAINGANTIASIYVKQGTANYFYIQFNDSGGGAKFSSFNLSTMTAGTQNSVLVAGVITSSNPTVTAIGGGWYRISVTLTGGLGTAINAIYGFADADASRSATVGKTLLAAHAQFEVVTYQTTPGAYSQTTSAAYYGPRFDYPNATAAGLLLEPVAATNYSLYSNTFNYGWWGVGALTTTANSGTSPDGTNDAWLLTATAGTSEHRVHNNYLSFLSAHYWELSIYVKAGTVNFVSLGAGISSVPYAVFNLSTGVVASSFGCTPSITNVGNGWYRIGINSPTATTLYLVLNIADTAAHAVPAVTWAAVGTETVLAFGSQAEIGQGSISSYIPAGATSVTRPAESLTATPAALGWSDTTGTLIVEGTFNTGAEKGIVTGIEGANLLELWKGDSTGSNPGQYAAQFASAGGGWTYDAATNLTNGSPARMGVQVISAVPYLSVNGGALVNGGSISPLASTVIGFGSRGGSSPLNYHLRSLGVYRGAMPSAVFRAKTTVGASYS